MYHPTRRVYIGGFKMKKYKFVIEAKNAIMEFGYENNFMYEDLKWFANSCKGTKRKYVKHVLRCGFFDENGWFSMPSTKLCLNTKH